MGATALTEKWDAGAGSSGSQNHFMSGEISQWFFEGLAGIGLSESGAGFKNMVIKPAVAGDLTWAKASYNTVSGLVTTYWQRKANKFLLDVAIPPNTRATVYIPTANTHNVMESGRAATIGKGIKFIRFENGQAVYTVLSGNYHFQSVMK